MALIYEVYKCTDIDSFLESLEIAEKHFTCMYIEHTIVVFTYLRTYLHRSHGVNCHQVYEKKLHYLMVENNTIIHTHTHTSSIS